MILRKVIENEKESYVQISFEDALNYENKNDLVFTDEEEKDRFEDTLEELEDENDNETNRFNEFYSNQSFKENYYEKSNKKNNKIIQMLPFLSQEDLHEIVKSILNNDEAYKDLQLVTIFPFLNQTDCDQLFENFIKGKWNGDNGNIACLLPFISQKALSCFVDEYINGNYQDVDINAFYPFMNASDIKRIFNYVLKGKK